MPSDRLALEPLAFVVEEPPRTSSLVLREVDVNPGIFKSELCRRLGLGWGTVSHHVQRLHASDALVIEIVAGKVCLFPRDTPQEQRLRLVASMRSERFLSYLEAGPITVPALCEASGLTRRVVQRKMDELLRAGLVDRNGRYRPVYRLKNS